MPFCCSGSEKAGWRDHGGTAVVPRELTTGRGAGLPTWPVTGLDHSSPFLEVARYPEAAAPAAAQLALRATPDPDPSLQSWNVEAPDSDPTPPCLPGTPSFCQETLEAHDSDQAALGSIVPQAAARLSVSSDLRSFEK